MDAAGFWDLTLREIEARLEGAFERLKREHDERAWLAWHTAGLGRVRRMPRLAKLQSRRKIKRQTPDEMVAIATAWTRALAPKQG